MATELPEKTEHEMFAWKIANTFLQMNNILNPRKKKNLSNLVLVFQVAAFLASVNPWCKETKHCYNNKSKEPLEDWYLHKGKYSCAELSRAISTDVQQLTYFKYNVSVCKQLFFHTSDTVVSS